MTITPAAPFAIERAARPDVRRAVEPVATGEVVRFSRITSAELFAPLPPVPWLVQALDMAPGAPTLFAGYGYTGKSLAAQALAIAVASGDLDAWGLFPVRHGRVLHIDYEQGRRLTCERYQDLCRGYGIAPQDLAGRLEVVALPPHYLDDPGAEDLLARELDGHALCIVDPFRGAAPATDENDSRAVRRVLDAFTRASERTGCVVTDIHHTRKPTEGAPGGRKMAIRGSGDFYSAHATVLQFDAQRGRPVVISHEKARVSGRLHPDFELVIEAADEGGLRVIA
ncbi:MAG: AAA family ATPase, partial [Gemmatimonadaceae bacterium]|nr:AAA family ATPase [Gemmatimonadaceae bacterium]